MKTKNKIKIIKQLAFIFSFCLVFSFASVFCLIGSEQYIVKSDFISFVTAARIINEGRGKDLYALEVQKEYQLKIVPLEQNSGVLPYRNPPLLAFFFVPFSQVPLFKAYWLYTLLLVSVTLFISWFSIKAFKSIKRSYWFLLPFVFYPSFIAIYAGQISTFLLLVFFLIYYSFKEKHSLLAGIAIGLLLLKPQYFIAFPFVLMLINNKKRFLNGFFTSTLLVILGSICISGIGFLKDYIQLLVQTENPLYGTKATAMFTLFSSLSQITSFPKEGLLMINNILYLLAVWYFYKNFKRFSLEINFTVLTLLTLVFCLHGVIVDMALILLPLWLLVDVYKTKGTFPIGNIVVIFILIFSSLLFTFKISFLLPFFFLLSVALLFNMFGVGYIMQIRR